jgi:hypothetical protein
VLRLVRFVKNSFAPITRVPLELLSLIPDYYREGYVDRDLITLTHVCRGWRDKFISRSSLWTTFNFTNADKTRTYIQRSQPSSSPYKIHLGKTVDDAFPLMTPHLHRLKFLTIRANDLPSVLTHFRCPTPLLEKLDVKITYDVGSCLDDALFNGDLPLLRELRLHGVYTHFPWKNLANLQVIDLKFHLGRYRITQILDFLESAPLLHTVSLQYPMPDSSDAPPERIVPLPHLKTFAIIANSPPSILLHHLHIPTGASLTSEFFFRGEESPLSDYLEKRSLNFSNLSDITAINIFFGSDQTFIKLSGPSGNLHVLASSVRILDTAELQLFRSLDPILSTTRKLAISYYAAETVEAGDCPIFQTLSSTNHLRTLILIDCFRLPFIHALDPQEHPSNLVLCPNLEELVLYLTYGDYFQAKNIVDMARNRASRGAKLSSITLVDQGDIRPNKEMFELKEHIVHVEFRFGDELPFWDEITGRSGGESE